MSVYTAAVQQLYITFLNRPADPAGLAFWEQQLANGVGVEEIAAKFVGSTEYQKAHADHTTLQRLHSLYENSFDHYAHAYDRENWLKALAKGTSIAQIGTTIAQGAQGADASILANKVIAANAFTALLAQQDQAISDALQTKAAAWLAGVTSADTLAEAIAGLPALTANALHTTVNDVRYIYDGDGAFSRTFPLNVVFSEAVYVDTSDGTPTILLQIGGVTRAATYVSGSGTTKLRFDMPIQIGDFTEQLDYTGITALELNGATIKNVKHQDVMLTLPAPGSLHSLAGSANIRIDTYKPVLLNLPAEEDGSGLHTGSAIELRFDEKIQIMDLKLLLQDASGKQSIELSSIGTERAHIRVGADGKSLIIDPPVALNPHTSYTLVVKEGWIFDLAYNKLAPLSLQFNTGDAGVPVIAAGSGDAAGTLSLSGETSGAQVVLDLQQHTLSQGVLPTGSFTTVDASHLEGNISVRLQDGATNHAFGSTGKDTLIGGDHAVNHFHGGAGSDTFVAGAGSENIFELAFGDYSRDALLNILEGAEQIKNWSAGHSNTIAVSGQALSTTAVGDTKMSHTSATVSIDEHGLAHFTNLDYLGYSFNVSDDRSVQFYMAQLISHALIDKPLGTAAVFNQGNSAILVVNAPYQPVPFGVPLLDSNNFVIQLVGVHSDGLVIENGNITTASFIANT